MASCGPQLVDGRSMQGHRARRQVRQAAVGAAARLGAARPPKMTRGPSRAEPGSAQDAHGSAISRFPHPCMHAGDTLSRQGCSMAAIATPPLFCTGRAQNDALQHGGLRGALTLHHQRKMMGGQGPKTPLLVLQPGPRHLKGPQFALRNTAAHPQVCSASRLPAPHCCQCHHQVGPQQPQLSHRHHHSHSHVHTCRHLRSHTLRSHTHRHPHSTASQPPRRAEPDPLPARTDIHPH
jgi:hypothetical protein